MKLLLDTHVLLWAACEPDKLSADTRLMLDSASNKLYFSTASLWEIAIKCQLGKADFQCDVSLLRRGLLDNGYEELAIKGEHAVAVGSLPPLHKDPFDRMLVAQATCEAIILLTSDEIVAHYPGPVRRV